MRTPTWIKLEDALMVHEVMIAQFGGSGGLRDEGLLLSALARPQQHFHYSEQNDLFELAAILTHGIVRNHPFVDGNKRVGFSLGLLFLRINGWRLKADEVLAVHFMYQLAEGKMDAAEFAGFLRKHSVREPFKKN